jgi:hypothetical protein
MKKGKVKKSKTEKPILPVIKPIPQKDNFLLTFFSKFWKLILGMGAICGILTAINPIIDFFKSQPQKHESNYFYSGDIKANGVTNSKSDAPITPNFYFDIKNYKYPPIEGIIIKNPHSLLPLSMMVGDYVFITPKINFSQGVEVFSQQIKDKHILDCGNSSLIIAEKDGKLYVSTQFKDIKNEEIIGIIEYNHWKLYKSNLLEFYSDDNCLEVTDKQNNIVFSIRYTIYNGMEALTIKGYFISTTTILILNAGKELGPGVADCVSKSDTDWKKNAEKEIIKIKTQIPIKKETIN